MNKQLTQTTIVTESQTAERLGSGLLAVFSTPALVAFMENTADRVVLWPHRRHCCLAV